MSLRLAVLGDVHGNVAALEATLAAIEKARPDAIALTGDLALNGPRPAEVVARVRDLAASGAYVIQGNTDIAVADFDYSAAFPWFEEVPAHYRAAAEWTHDQLTDADLDFLRCLPAERRIHAGDELVLVCHASPGSQTDGLPVELDAAVTVQRITRTDARIICCGHTHVADVRDYGRRLVCNPGSCGYAFDGDPDAAWALVTVGDDGELTADLQRTPYDPLPVADELSARGLPGDVYRAATVRTGRFVR